MKLAFTGTHGIGKTTLGRWLAEYLNIPYVPEFAREVLESGKKTDSLLDFVEFEDSILEMKTGEEEKLEKSGVEHYISDRSYLDYMVYLKYGMSKHPWQEVLSAEYKERNLREFFAGYEAACRQHNRKYDMIVFVLPFTNEISLEDDKRDKNPFSMEVIQDLLLKEYTNEIGQGRVFIMQEKKLERRKEFLLELLDRRGYS